MSNTPINSQQPQNQASNLPNPPHVEEIGFLIIEEIDRLEDMVMDGISIPFINKTLVDEEAITRQLDDIRINIPDCYAQAVDILAQREKMIADAQNYAQKIVTDARNKASQLLDESRITKQAENQAYQIKKQVQTDCENLQRKTMSEVEQIRKKIQQEVIQMKKQALVEADEIHREADNYTDSVLLKLERDLSEMLRITTNGRQQVYQNSQPTNRPPNMKINQKVS